MLQDTSTQAVQPTKSSKIMPFINTMTAACITALLRLTEMYSEIQTKYQDQMNDQFNMLGTMTTNLKQVMIQAARKQFQADKRSALGKILIGCAGALGGLTTVIGGLKARTPATKLKNADTFLTKLDTTKTNQPFASSSIEEQAIDTKDARQFIDDMDFGKSIEENNTISQAQNKGTIEDRIANLRPEQRTEVKRAIEQKKEQYLTEQDRISKTYNAYGNLIFQPIGQLLGGILDYLAAEKQMEKGQKDSKSQMEQTALSTFQQHIMGSTQDKLNANPQNWSKIYDQEVQINQANAYARG